MALNVASGALATLLALGLVSCTARHEPPERQLRRDADPALCSVFGYKPGSDAYAQCVDEVEKAMWRHARSARARVNCTPMGDRTVCQ